MVKSGWKRLNTTENTKNSWKQLAGENRWKPLQKVKTCWKRLQILEKELKTATNEQKS